MGTAEDVHLIEDSLNKSMASIVVDDPETEKWQLEYDLIRNASSNTIKSNLLAPKFTSQTSEKDSAANESFKDVIKPVRRKPVGVGALIVHAGSNSRVGSSAATSTNTTPKHRHNKVIP